MSTAIPIEPVAGIVEEDEVKKVEEDDWRTEYMNRANELEDEWEAKCEDLATKKGWKERMTQTMFIKLFRVAHWLGNKFKSDERAQETIKMIKRLVIVTPDVKSGTHPDLVGLKTNPFSASELSTDTMLPVTRNMQKKVIMGWAACMNMEDRYRRIMWAEESVWADLEGDKNAKMFIGGLSMSRKWKALKKQNATNVVRIFNAMHVVNIHARLVAGLSRPPRKQFENLIHGFKEAIENGDQEEVLRRMLNSTKGDFMSNASQMLEAAGGLPKAMEELRNMVKGPEQRKTIRKQFMKTAGSVFDSVIDGFDKTDVKKEKAGRGKKMTGAEKRRAAARAKAGKKGADEAKAAE